jgi:hypothetical protein
MNKDLDFGHRPKVKENEKMSEEIMQPVFEGIA